MAKQYFQVHDAIQNAVQVKQQLDIGFVRVLKSKIKNIKFIHPLNIYSLLLLIIFNYVKALSLLHFHIVVQKQFYI